MAPRLAPAVSPDTEFFWTGLAEHKLLIQRCSCRTFDNDLVLHQLRHAEGHP